MDATYTITFAPDQSWSLSRNGRTVLENQRNFSLDASYPAVDGVQVKVGGLSFRTTTFAGTEMVADADGEDAGLTLLDGVEFFGDPDATAATFWSARQGGDPDLYGTDDAAPLSRDLEIRFTGVWSEDQGEIVAGGSFATLAGLENGTGNRDLDAHPHRPPDAPAIGPFLQRIPFEVWDVEEPDRARQLNLSFYDRGADGAADAGVYHQTFNMDGLDYITVIATDYDSTRVHDLENPDATWVFFFAPEGASTWSTGDILRVNFLRPVVPGEDEFQFTTAAPAFSLAAARTQVERINVFPNPYYGVNQAETSPYIHFVTFSHLPPRAIIRIYDLAGVLVQKIEKTDPSQFQRWYLDNHEQLPIASGLYIAHIEMPDLGQSKVLKLAIVQEQQFVERY